MAEIRTVTTLRYRRDEIERAIANYERCLAQAQTDLGHINAATRFSKPAAIPRAWRIIPILIMSDRRAPNRGVRWT